MSNQIFKLITKLFPISRSISGPGNLKTLTIIKGIIPIKIKRFKTGKKVYDWIIPEEWHISDGYIEDSQKNRIIDFKENNLHVVSHSIPINKLISLSQLKKKLFFLKRLPNAIPYKTSYYKKDWGFCLSYNDFKKLKDKKYNVVIKSEFKKGFMHYGELLIKGRSNKEILLKSYICHPSMANNELSGPGVLTFLTKYLLGLKSNYYTIRVVLLPETIGTIAYINKNITRLKKNFHTGMIVTCVGKKSNFNFVKSINENSIINRVVKHYFQHKHKNSKIWSYLERGSDERQYNSPNINIDVGSFTSAKFGKFKEYHTSLDNLNCINNNQLNISLEALKEIIELINLNGIYKSTKFCEPFYTKYKLYPDYPNHRQKVQLREEVIMDNVVSYSNGKRDLIEIANINNLYLKDLKKYSEKLIKNKIIKRLN